MFFLIDLFLLFFLILDKNVGLARETWSVSKSGFFQTSQVLAHFLRSEITGTLSVYGDFFLDLQEVEHEKDTVRRTTTMVCRWSLILSWQ